jgi:molybdopterin-containing oxidoreductase family iron-sulfur binding subunit
MTTPKDPRSKPSPTGPSSPDSEPGFTRRGFFRGALGAAGGTAALAAALSPLREVDFSKMTLEEFLPKYYRRMSPEEIQQAIAKVREQVKERWGVDAEVRDPKPLDGVEYVYALNLGRCIGCRRCVYACTKENNQSRDPQIQYIRVIEMPRGSIDLERGNHHYDREEVPDENHYYIPVQCHQCANPPCVKVCPVTATWQEPDGITVIDYNWCIGCRYCAAACPYWARRFNYAEPTLPAEEVNPDMGYLSNRPRPKGVMEKCTFCLHRTRVGRMPACLEVCPVGARKFGNILDPESEVTQILETKHVYVLKQSVGTLPRFFYFFDQDYHLKEEG